MPRSPKHLFRFTVNCLPTFVGVERPLRILRRCEGGGVDDEGVRVAHRREAELPWHRALPRVQHPAPPTHPHVPEAGSSACLHVCNDHRPKLN